MDEKIVRQIVLSRYYLHLARNEIRFLNDTSTFAAINLLHEATESFLLSVIEVTEAPIKKNTNFEGYLDAIDKKLSPKALSGRSALLRFNKARVAAKHHLVLPDREQTVRFFRNIEECFELTSKIAFDRSFDEINLINLIESDEIRGHLYDALDQYQNQEYFACLSDVRKAIYVEFEKSSDIKKFSDATNSDRKGILSPFHSSNAPTYARSADYIERNVKTPFDYIVLDHSKQNSKLLEEGIDPQAFWNIWRLTPSVYQFEDSSWVVEEEISVLNDPHRVENARYVLDSAVEILLKIQNRRSTSRFISHRDNFVFLTMKSQSWRIYDKASVHSENQTVPTEVTFFCAMSLVPSLDQDDENFWIATHIKKGGPWLSGCLRENDVVISPNPPEGWPDW